MRDPKRTTPNAPRYIRPAIALQAHPASFVEIMPELAEVEYYRKRWDPGIGSRIKQVLTHPHAVVFRGCDVAALEKHLTGATLRSSEASAKQILFRFSGDAWLGIHLGMTGKLDLTPTTHTPEKAEHLVLRQATHSLIFSDFRKFGRIQFHVALQAPAWWTSIAPAILSPEFTVKAVTEFLHRRKKAPIKPVLLMQERFPGIGNWMADEILWRAHIHPKQPAASLTPAEMKALHTQCRWVCREALKTIGQTLEHPAKTWLFPHRWENGGRCPTTGVKLVRETIGGRTACWSPTLQKLHS